MFLEWGVLHVRVISPTPARPKAVSFLPPQASIILRVSSIPLVIKPAFALSPNFKPSDIPAPIAIIFFIAPAIDEPIVSSLRYNLREL